MVHNGLHPPPSTNNLVKLSMILCASLITHLLIATNIHSLSGAQKHRDITPTGCIHHAVTKKEDCYSHISKPDCSQLNCPNSFELSQCKHIVNCRTATQEEYAKASFQFNTAMPPNLSHVLLSWLIALPDFRPESEGVTEHRKTP